LRGGATDFAQKYLFKSSEEHCDEDYIDFMSASSDGESIDEDCFDQESFPNETSQGTLDQNELSNHMSVSSQERQMPVASCQDLLFTCCDWENCREDYTQSDIGFLNP